MDIADHAALRALFPGATRQVYLDVAAVGIISARTVVAMRQVTESHAQLGIAAAGQWRDTIARTRRLIADLVGGAADRVAYTQNTSTGLALVINGLDWRNGDNVVVPSAEFPSNFYPWLQLRRMGVEVRQVPMSGGHADLDQLDQLVDGRTRVVAVSAVQYSSGYRYDLGRLAEACRRHEALLVVDGTQAVGAVRVEADAAGVDVLAVSGHKWMLGPFGAAFVHLSQRAMERLVPSVVGWFSVEDPFSFDHEPILAADARRFESGTEPAANIAGLAAAIELILELGVDRVEKAILDRTEELAAALAAIDLKVRRGDDRNRWSGILIASTGADDATWHARLLDEGVRCSLRNGLRFAPHIFTTTDDVAAVADVLRSSTR